MLVWISLFVVSFLFGMFDIFIYQKISNSNIDCGIKAISSVIVYSLVTTVAIVILGNQYKMILTILLAIILLKFLFNDNLSKIIIGFIIMYISFALSEAILFILISISFGGYVNQLLNDPMIIIIINFGVLTISYLIFKNKVIRKFCINLLQWFNSKCFIKEIFTIMMIVIIIAYILYKNFTTNLSIQYAIFSFAFMIGIIIFIVGYFNEKARNNRLTYKYDQLYDYSRTYETELAEKSKSQHEHRNQLVIIKNLIDSDTKEAISYIEKIMEKDLTNKNLHWLNKLKNIPYGGLKGLLYYKIMEMLNNEIEIYVNISEKLYKKSLWKIYEENAQDITRVIGVYIDNAIEAASVANEKFIIIDVLYENENIEFVFSNTYINNIDLTKIDKEGYSSKGKGRGYGLSLVKDILDGNDKLSQEREINGKFYVQKLIIKTK